MALENPRERMVYVVDDDPAARQSVAALAQSHGLPVQTFNSAEDFLAHYQPQMRGCLVLDVRMNQMSGLDLQEELKQRGSTLPVIMITGYADIPMAVRAMYNGAVTFLEKPAGDQELWRYIQIALDQEQHLATIQAQKNEIEANFNSLSTGEKQVLEKLLAGLPNKAIAVDLDMGLRTVEMRRAIIMKKMQAGSLAELVRLIIMIRP
ncbi:MAG: response regulator [Pirellulales bacterium]|nr:response regulator [Pirellulales bacterium]